MDATLHKQKLNFNNSRYKLNGVKARIFEPSGMVKNYRQFLVSSHPDFQQSTLHTGKTGFTKPRCCQAFSIFIESDLFLLTIKDKRI